MTHTASDQYDPDWTGERCWELVEARLDGAFLDAMLEMSRIVDILRERESSYASHYLGRLRKRVINGAYAHDFGYWRRGGEAPLYALKNDVEEEIMDAIVYMAIRRWVEDERRLDQIGADA